MIKPVVTSSASLLQGLGGVKGGQGWDGHSDRVFPWEHSHSHPFFFPSGWKRLLNWNKNPGWVILERQAKCPGQFGSGLHQDGDTDGSAGARSAPPDLGNHEDSHRSSPSLGLLPLPRREPVHPGTGNWGRASGYPAVEEPGAAQSSVGSCKFAFPRKETAPILSLAGAKGFDFFFSLLNFFSLSFFSFFPK